MTKRFPLLLAVIIVLVATGVATSLRHATNPSALPSGLSVSINAESTALYCTGLANGTKPGKVTFLNTASSPRSLSVSVVSDHGTSWNGTIELAAHAAQTLTPSAVVAVKRSTRGRVLSETYGVAVQISGGGVVGNEIAGSTNSEVPCSADGVTRWFAAGFNTLVGSSAYLSVYNPTGTSAVFNASIYTTAGYSAPQSFQGLSVAAHTQSEIDLGHEVVNTANVGVGVKVLRGSLEIVGVEDSNGIVSLDRGLSTTLSEAWFPNVTTARSATAEIRLANPNATPANVTLDVSLGNFKVAPLSQTVAPFTTGLITVTPNSAIPISGYASLTLHSNVGVIAGLATGTNSWIALTSPVSPTNEYVIHDFTGLGFDAATVTNTSSRSVTLKVFALVASKKSSRVVADVKLAGGASDSLANVVSTFMKGPSDTYLITSPKPTLVASMTLRGHPKGLDVVTALDGR